MGIGVYKRFGDGRMSTVRGRAEVFDRFQRRCKLSKVIGYLAHDFQGAHRRTHEGRLQLVQQLLPSRDAHSLLSQFSDLDVG